MPRDGWRAVVPVAGPLPGAPLQQPDERRWQAVHRPDVPVRPVVQPRLRLEVRPVALLRQPEPADRDEGLPQREPRPAVLPPAQQDRGGPHRRAALRLEPRWRRDVQLRPGRLPELRGEVPPPWEALLPEPETVPVRAGRVPRPLAPEPWGEATPFPLVWGLLPQRASPQVASPEGPGLVRRAWRRLEREWLPEQVPREAAG